MRATINHLRTLAAAGLVVAATGCSGLGPISDILGGSITPATQGGELAGEIRSVDTRAQTIGIRTPEGRTGQVGFDSRTRVIFQEQEYPVTALEEGDHVTMRVRQEGQTGLFTDMVHVQRNVRDERRTPGDGISGQVLQGTVEWTEAERGRFELRGATGEVLVSLPYGAREADRDRFTRLRAGDAVRVEVERIGEGRFEVIRFM